MGHKSHLTPGDFSKSFNDFLVQVVEAQGGRPTERWAEANMPASRGRSYWGKLLAGSQAMTTEDISEVSKWLGVSPFEFVRAVRLGDLSLVGVGGSDEDTNSNVTDIDFVRGLPRISEAIPVDEAAKKRRGPNENEGVDGGSDSTGR